MKQFLKKSCFTITLRKGVLIICITSIVIYGFCGAALPSIFNIIVQKLSGSPALMQFAAPLLLVVSNLTWIMRSMGITTLVASLLLLASWFLMNKYSGTGPGAGIFSCFSAVNPLNIQKRKDLKWLMLPWVVCSCSFFISLVYLTVDTVMKCSNLNTGTISYVLPPILTLLVGLLQVYCILVVISYYYEQTNA